jgi:SAM-dependent methyltransferase
VTAPDYVARNDEAWTAWASEYAAKAERNWSADPHWGIWHVPDSDLGLLAGLDGRDAVELGCGTGYVSAWMARRGARVVGVDVTAAQLATAALMQERFGVRFPLVRAAAERAPFAGGSFDVAVSEYGAALWSDPYRWIPEAARLLRPGGQLVILANTPLLILCSPDADEPADATLKRPYFDMHRFEWPDDAPAVEFHLNHGDMIRLFRSCGFVVEDLIELRAPEGATTTYAFVTSDWAHRWPSEEIWRVRKATN